MWAKATSWQAGWVLGSPRRPPAPLSWRWEDTRGKARGHCVGHGIKNVPECFSGRGYHWVLEALPGVGELLAVDAEGRMSTWDSHDPDPAVSGGGNERQSDFFEATQPSIPSLCLSPHVAAAFIL